MLNLHRGSKDAAGLPKTGVLPRANQQLEGLRPKLKGSTRRFINETQGVYDSNDLFFLDGRCIEQVHGIVKQSCGGSVFAAVVIMFADLPDLEPRVTIEAHHWSKCIKMSLVGGDWLP